MNNAIKKIAKTKTENVIKMIAKIRKMTRKPKRLKSAQKAKLVMKNATARKKKTRLTQKKKKKQTKKKKRRKKLKKK